MKYKYKLFGISVESDILLPEGLMWDGEPEAFVKFGITPAVIPAVVLKTDFFWVADNEFLLWVDGIAKYHVKEGCQISIEPCGGSDDEIRLFLLSSAFGALIHQRGLLPFHASAVARDGKAYLFAGISGAGKSTLAAALLPHGFELVADDVCVVSAFSDLKPLLLPGYPLIKLWADSLGKLGKTSESLRKVRTHFTKFALPTHQQFHNQNAEIETFYILNPTSNKGISIEEIRGVSKFKALYANIFRQYLIQGNDRRSLHFQHLNYIASQCTVKQVNRPLNEFLLDELIQALLSDIATS